MHSSHFASSLLLNGTETILRQWSNLEEYVYVVVINHRKRIQSLLLWASFQLRKIAVCARGGKAGNVFPATEG